MKTMPFDGIVTRAVTEQLQETLIGGRINKIYQPTETELLLTVRNQRKNFTLLLSVHPTYSRFHLTEQEFINPEQPPMFCMHMRKYLIGGIITDIEQKGMERIVTFTLLTRDELGVTTHHYLVVEIMGRHSNIILLDEHKEKIIDSIKHVPPFQNRHRSILPGHLYIEPPAQNKLNPLDIEEEQFLSRIDFNGGKIDRQIVQIVDGFSPVIAKEIISRAGIGSIENYWTAFKQIRDDIKNKKYDAAIYTGAREDFHVVSLEHFSGEKETYPNVNAMLDAFFSGKAERDRVQQQTRDIRRFIENEVKKNKRKIKIHNNTLQKAKEADKYQKYGELLTAHLHLVKQGDTKITVIDYYDPHQGEITIPLQQDISPSKNAQRFFTRYRKLKAAKDRVVIELEKTKEEITYLEQLLQQIDQARIEDIEEIREELVEGGYLRKHRKAKRKKPKKPMPEKFVSSDGTPIYVGRNNRQNDYLTHRLANRTDTWLHTKDIPGSHVVIRSKEPSQKTIEEAAILAAYYSKAQQSESVPVDFTEIRYVNKPQGGKPGFVTYVNEQTLFVTPNEKIVKQLKENINKERPIS